MSQRKGGWPSILSPRVELDVDGVWHVRGFAEARQLLRSADTQQAGFNADFVLGQSSVIDPPILYLEGPPHHDQRRDTAKFFTPVTVAKRYQARMEGTADRLLAGLRQAGRGRLDRIARTMAMTVVAGVLGLTNSWLPGMERRVAVLFEIKPRPPHSWPDQLRQRYAGQLVAMAIYVIDVQPAIRARRLRPQEDLISHLLSVGCNDRQVLTECITYAAAGMVTTREFISMATWHFLSQPELRSQYLALSSRAERQDFLSEILRLDPVIGRLYRRTLADVSLDGAVIPAGSLVEVSPGTANVDEAVTGTAPLEVCPFRELHATQVTPAVMSFGDGHHRCPGQFLALAEADTFLTRLLAIPGLEIEQPPHVSWDQAIGSYELRDFWVRIRSSVPPA
ncbi:MAG: cytochrome P450 [Chloroflexi bacterium]|nr:cytochrome P450 [Chloroflexota bacterium]